MNEEVYLRCAVIAVYYRKLFISSFLWLLPSLDANYARLEFGSEKYRKGIIVWLPKIIPPSDSLCIFPPRLSSQNYLL